MKKFAGVVVATLFILHLLGTNTFASDFYIVKQGDTLWQIAQNNKISVEELKQINNLESDFLKIGQKLLLQKAPTPSETTSPSTQENTSEYITYTVQSGDTLWNIANQHNTTVDILYRINNLTSDKLSIGQQLLIPNQTNEAIIVEQPIIQELSSRAGGPVSGDRVIAVAAQYLGTPYKYGGQGPSGFDCSGFVKYVYNKFNINLNRTAADQYKHGVAVSKDELQIGDLVFFASGKYIDHVGIYSGNGMFIHSSSSRSGGVIYSSLTEGYYARTYVGAKRIL